MLGRTLSVLIVAGLSLLANLAQAGCRLNVLAELPVTMSERSPLIAVKINGTEASFIADSGAFYSTITRAAAAELHLKLRPPPFGLTVTGVGGVVDVSVTTVKEFTLGHIPLPNIEFVVGGSFPAQGAIGLLGQNVFRVADVEYDLAGGVIKLIRPDGCKDLPLVYWEATGRPYSVMDIKWATPMAPHTLGTAFVNGAKIEVMFDTGAATSVLSLRAAARAGVKPDGGGVVDGGPSYGIGRRVENSWIAPFERFKIGDEEIQHTHLRIAALQDLQADMLVGADFFLSHHVYVASSQRKLYFTYNGGSVFNLTTGQTSASAPAQPPTPAPGAAQSADDGHPPMDAEAFSRRGTAFAARRDLDHALADLTRACELQPDEPRYFYERGRVRLEARQPVLAMADFDAAIKLKPDHVPSLVSRAELRIGSHDYSEAIADLNTADHAASKESDVRLLLGHLFTRAEQPAAAILQYDQWIPVHRDDARMSDAFAARCLATTLAGAELKKALGDCNTALRMNSNDARTLAVRGLTHLRLGQVDASIADYDVALRTQPKNPWALYGRGMDKLRKGMTAEGHADMQAATEIWPPIANAFKNFNIAAP
jgi:tetratricopeptide (TPR) repeat protein